MDTNQSAKQLTKWERRELRQQERLKQQQQKARARTIKKMALWSFLALAIGGGIFGLTRLPNNPASDLSTATASASDWIKGNKEAKVVLSEYSD